MKNNKVFIKITNNDIYNEIKMISKQLDEFQKENEIAHARIINDHEKNKNRIEIVKWIAGSALSIGIFLCANLLLKII